MLDGTGLETPQVKHGLDGDEEKFRLQKPSSLLQVPFAHSLHSDMNQRGYQQQEQNNAFIAEEILQKWHR